MREIESLFLRLKKSGIHLWLDQETGQLRFKAPKGALTPNLKAEIKTSKAAILKFLGDIEQTQNRAESRVTSVSRADGVPLSFAQQRLWFLYQMDGKSATYNIPACRRIFGKIDVESLQKSLNKIVRRHEVLRTNFATKGEIEQQIIAPNLMIPIKLHDLSKQTKNEQDGTVKTQIKAETEHAFDLEKETLLRFSLLKISEQEHVLILVIHHIVCDGWSMEIFIRELMIAYQSFVSGQTPDMADLAVQYADFSIWQRRWAQDGGLDHQLEYWKNKLLNVPDILDLPADRPRPPVQSYRGGVEFFSIDQDLTARLAAFCKQEKASLFMGLHAAFNCLVHRYTGSVDLVMGTHTAGRMRQDQESLIGFFINTLPLRVDLSGDPSFKEVIRRVSQSAVAAFSHQDVPFEKLVELVRPDRNMSHAPLVQVMCVLQNMPMGKADGIGQRVETIDLQRTTSKFDLSLLMEDTGEGLECEFEFNSDLFDRPRMRRMAEHFVALLKNMLENVEAKISTATYLKSFETHELLEDFNAAQNALEVIPNTANIHQVFEHYAAQNGSAAAVVHKGVVHSYQDINNRANQLAHTLLKKNLKPEAVVALCFDTSPDMIVSMLATLKAGASYLPLEPGFPQQRLDFIVQDTAAVVVLTHQKYTDKFDAHTPLILLDGDAAMIAGQSDQNPNIDIASDRLAYVIYTSGSTGTPKGVMIEHRSVLDLVEGLKSAVYQNIHDPIRVGLMASIVFDASVQQIFGTLLQGHALYLIDKDLKQDGPALVRFVLEQDIDLIDATPTLVSVMVDAGLVNTPPKVLKQIIVGGEPLPFALAQKFQDSDIVLINAYGPTECCVDATTLRIQSIKETGDSVSIGRPLGRCRAYILDPMGQPVPIGVNGELHISGTGLFRGYVNLPKQTEQFRVPNPFINANENDAVRTTYEYMYRTGDICRWLENGEIAIVGRNDDQVKIRGYRIELGEIETQLKTHDEVDEAVVVVHKNKQGSQELSAYLVLDGQLDVGTLHAYLQAKIPSYMIPTAFYDIPKVPINNNGKIDKNALLALNDKTTSLAQGQNYRAPRTPAQSILCDMFADILAVEQVGINDNFFFLGGDSIKALQIAARLHRQNIELEIRNIFLHPTVEALALTLQEVAHTGPQKTDFSGTIPLTAVQHWFFEAYENPRLHFNQSVLLKFKGHVDVEAFTTALKAIVERHDALRLQFVKTELGYVPRYGEMCFGLEVADCPDHVEVDEFLEEKTQALQSKIDLQTNTGEAGIYRFADHDQVFIAIHHLVVDTVSWRGLFDDLNIAYQDALAGKRPSLPMAPTSFGQWAEGIQDYANGDALKHLAYWKDIDSRCDTAQNIGPSTHADCLAKTVRLTRAATDFLMTQAHEAYNTGVDDLLLAALSQTFVEWQGETQTMIMIEGHGREHIIPQAGIGETVGWFTSIYPVVLHASQALDLGLHIKSIKEQLRRIPDKGVGYGILRYVTDKKHLDGYAFQATPNISFNYLGQFETETSDGVFTLSSQQASPNIDPAASQPFGLEIICMVFGGVMEITMSYSTKHYTAQSIEKMQDIYQHKLMDLVDFAISREVRELTPSDIDYDGFDQHALDVFVETVQARIAS